MSDTVSFSFASMPFKPTEFNAPAAREGGTGAFAAIVASLGYQSIQTPAPVGANLPASLARSEAEGGNIVPVGVSRADSVARMNHRLVDTSDPAWRGAKPLPRAVPASLVSRPAAAPDVGMDVSDFSSTHEHDRPLKLATLDQTEYLGGARKPRIALGEGDGSASVFETRFANVEASAISAAKTGPVLSPNDSLPLLAPGGINTTASLTAPVLSADSPHPLHHPRFADGLSQQVSVMASDGIQRARITINPPELGQLELRIVVRNDEAAVQMASPHAAVRDALEDALPRLREQFEQAGMALSDSEVFDQLPQQSESHGESESDFEGSMGGRDADDPNLGGLSDGYQRQGLVDAYV